MLSSINKQLTMESFLQLEAGWANQGEESTDTDTDQQQQQDVPLHVQIFYNSNPNDESQQSAVEPQPQ